MINISAEDRNICRGFCLQTTEINIDCVGVSGQICILNHSQTAAVQQNNKMKEKGRKGTRRNRHSVVGMKTSVHPKDEKLKGSLVMTYSFYAAAEKHTVPRQIL